MWRRDGRGDLVDSYIFTCITHISPPYVKPFPKRLVNAALSPAENSITIKCMTAAACILVATSKNKVPFATRDNPQTNFVRSEETRLTRATPGRQVLHSSSYPSSQKPPQESRFRQYFEAVFSLLVCSCEALLIPARVICRICPFVSARVPSNLLCWVCSLSNAVD